VARSNAHAQVLLEAIARFNPEYASVFGAATYDEQVLDLGPRREERSRAALARAQAELEKRLASEKDPNVRQDLRILLMTARDNIQSSSLDERYLLSTCCCAASATALSACDASALALHHAGRRGSDQVVLVRPVSERVCI